MKYEWTHGVAGASITTSKFWERSIAKSFIVNPISGIPHSLPGIPRIVDGSWVKRKWRSTATAKTPPMSSHALSSGDISASVTGMVCTDDHWAVAQACWWALRVRRRADLTVLLGGPSMRFAAKSSMLYWSEVESEINVFRERHTRLHESRYAGSSCSSTKASSSLGSLSSSISCAK